MQVNSIQSTQNTAFKGVVLGNGGAKRLAEKMGVEKAKEFIRINKPLQSDIVITENKIEVISPDKKRLVEFVRRVTTKSTSAIIEIKDHGITGLFICKGPFPDEELLKYGAKNKEFSMAEKFAKEIDAQKIDTKDSIIVRPVDIPEKIKADAEEIERFCNMYYTF